MSRPHSIQYSCRGFSLIELLVVLVIMTLLAGTVSLAMGVGSKGEDSLEHTAHALRASFELAREEAVLANEYLGMHLPASETGEGRELGWLRYRNGQWQSAGAQLVNVPLHGDLSLTLSLEGESLPLVATGEAVQPVLLMDPSGDPGDFELRVRERNGEVDFVLYTSELGELTEAWRED